MQKEVKYYEGTNIIFRETHYIDGVKNGIENFFDPQGKPWIKTNYKDGVAHGEHKHWSGDRGLVRHEVWENGNLVKTLYIHPTLKE